MARDLDYPGTNHSLDFTSKDLSLKQCVSYLEITTSVTKAMGNASHIRCVGRASPPHTPWLNMNQRQFSLREIQWWRLNTSIQCFPTAVKDLRLFEKWNYIMRKFRGEGLQSLLHNHLSQAERWAWVFTIDVVAAAGKNTLDAHSRLCILFGGNFRLQFINFLLTSALITDFLKKKKDLHMGNVPKRVEKRHMQTREILSATAHSIQYPILFSTLHKAGGFWIFLPLPPPVQTTESLLYKKVLLGRQN